MGNKANYNSNRDEKKKRKHDHLTMSRTGWIPQRVGITNLRILKR